MDNNPIFPGILPDRRLWFNVRYFSNDSPAILDGMMPTRLLVDIIRALSIDNRPMPDGMDPVRLLRLRNSTVSFDIVLIVDGMMPVRQLLAKLSSTVSVSKAMDEGIDPDKPIFLSPMLTTVPVLHLNPLHAVGVQGSVTGVCPLHVQAEYPEILPILVACTRLQIASVSKMTL